MTISLALSSPLHLSSMEILAHHMLLAQSLPAHKVLLLLEMWSTLTELVHLDHTHMRSLQWALYKQWNLAGDLLFTLFSLSLSL